MTVESNYVIVITLRVILPASLSELQIIARNCDWFIALFAPVVIGRSNCFGFGFSTVN